APYAPHICEELWHQLGNNTSVLEEGFPKYERKYTVESTKEYPVSINGRLRTTIVIDLNASKEQVEQIVMANDVVKKWVDDKPVKKFIFVKGKMVNVVI
ncbi:MAG TPA: class I tRNA ligase family protein, partial [Chitinophagaceae bacterium]|nr:class I tRNA ligase family protein [Chitinophagaceae bacterium]